MTAPNLRVLPIDRLQVSVDEAAHLLGYSKRTVYEMMERGELRSVGRGRLRRIPIDELKRWQRDNME